MEADEPSSYLNGSYDSGLAIRVLQQAETIERSGSGPSYCDGVITTSCGNIGPFKTTGMRISYIGEGKLRFVSGFRFLPGGEPIGLINDQDISYVPLSATRSKTLVLWVLSSNHGIRDIITTEMGIEPGFSNVSDSIITRRFLGTGPDGIHVKDFYIGLGISEVTEIGIRSPNIKDREGLDREEWFLQSYSWTPRIPPTFLRRDIQLDHYSFVGESMYSNRQERKRAPPMQYAVFDDKKISRLGCWLNSNHEICGMSFFLEASDNPLVIGSTTELSVDTAIGDDDILTSIDIFMHGENGPIISLIVRIFSAIPIAPPSETNDKSSEPRLSSLGIITSHNISRIAIETGSRLKDKSIVRNLDSYLVPETIKNPRFQSLDDIEGPMSRLHFLKAVKGKQPLFVSTSRLVNCCAIDCYVQDNPYQYRITGLCIHHDKDPDQPQSGQQPITLGSICRRGLTKTTFNIHSDEGEYIIAINIYMGRMPLRTTEETGTHVVGIFIWTSNDRKLSVGRCNVDAAMKVYYLRSPIDDDLAIQWVFTGHFDYVFNPNSELA
ncbi:hypothetical protein TWF694_001476 [Orbilia ellipsospora]|uniref:Uncharacterized protein n=1 Tax=Orbilia ellipsospora TaxID=2528407 RepID=A0AAV9XRW6_9PEZI